jgi:hypothetical protein
LFGGIVLAVGLMFLDVCCGDKVAAWGRESTVMVFIEGSDW